MSGIGEELRAARLARGYSLAEVERATRIRARLIEALEAEEWPAFASLPQARGFLRNYAEFLGLDGEAALAGLNLPGQNKRRSGVAPAAAPPAGTGPAHVPRGWRGQARRIFTRDLVIGVAVTLIFGLLLVWGALQLWQRVAVSATPSPTSALAAALTRTSAPEGPATPTTTPTPEATATAPLPTPLPNYVGVNLVIRAQQRLWLRVIVDGAETFLGQMAPGDTRQFAGNTAIEVWTGNAHGTRVVFNGQDQGTLGGLGEVAIRIWTIGGPVTPTASPTATP